MARIDIFRRTALGLLLAGAAGAVLGMPTAWGDPESPETPNAPEAPATSAPVAGDCTAAGLADTITSVSKELSVYFAAHPDVNAALLDFTRQPAFVAVGQFDGYFKDHPQQADELRAIQAPLTAYKDRCDLQVAPTDALAVLAEV